MSGDVYGNSFNVTSDRNAKENFVAVNPQQVLKKVAALSVTKWNYKTEKSAEHIGPVAQDFRKAFGLNGEDDKHISLVHEGGIALAAIQGLNDKLNEKDKEVQNLKLQNDSLAKQLAELEMEVKAIEQKK